MFEGDFPSGQVVNTLHFHSTAGGMCSIGGWGAETPHVAWSGQGKKKLIGIYVLNLHTDHRILSLSNFKDKKLRHKRVPPK